jgi:hypothetical protein
MPEPQQQARTKFVKAKEVTKGTITQIYIEQDPFHCTLKIEPKDPTVIPIEGRYSSNQLSLGKLKRNLVHLQFQIETLDDILTGLESLEGRECDFRIDKSGWLEWILKLYPRSNMAPLKAVEPIIEIFFIRVPSIRAIYRMEDPKQTLLGWAVGPTGIGTHDPHGWVLYLETIEEAKDILKKRKKI